MIIIKITVLLTCLLWGLHSSPIFEYNAKQFPISISNPRYKDIKQSSISREDFNKWLEEQKLISFKKILQNIGGLGNYSLDEVAEGVVIASPSRSNPNYFYQWVRDAAITMNSLIDFLQDNNFNDDEFQLQPIIESYITNAYYIQRVENPSGGFHNDELLSGLGEPKFMPDNSPFLGNWGRPQRDGAGLRLITVINYLKLLSSNGKHVLNNTLLQDEQWIYQEIVKNDLQYIIKNWNADGFDLWEEINSKHLFTSLTQLKALQIGLQICEEYDDEDVNFKLQLQSTFISLRSFLEIYGFKNSNIPYLIETPSLLWKNIRNGLDILTILLSLRSHDVTSLEDSIEIPFDVGDPYVLNTLTYLVNDMKYRYPINHKNIGLETMGMALGRYPEDVYNGNGLSEGNPWFIATATASEMLYKVIYQLYQNGDDVDLTIEFYQQFFAKDIHRGSGQVQQVLKNGSEEFHELMLNLIKYADSFLDVIREHVDNSGSMSEQFNRNSGFLQGASDLTWSYSALWSSFRWRFKVLQIVESKGLQI